MAPSNLISTRLRIVAPVAGIGAALSTRFAALALDEGRGTTEDISTTPNRDPLGSLLSLVPGSILSSPEPPFSLVFGDVAAQLAAGKIEPPDSIDDADGMTLWINASYPIAIAEPFRSYALKLSRSFIGFDVTDIDQSLEVGAPPETRTLFRGRFDQDAVATAWEVNGYRLSRVDDITVATLFEDAQIDLSNEISRIAFTRMNNAAFLPDGTLAYAPTRELMMELIAVAKGEEPAIGQDDGIVTLLQSLTAPLASAIFFPGDALSIASQMPVDLSGDETVVDEFMAALEATGPIPPIALGIVGITPGGPTRPGSEDEAPPVLLPDATIVYRLLMSESGSAANAADVVLGRLESMKSIMTGEPFAEMYELREASSILNGAVLGVDLRPADGRSIALWTNGFYARDLPFLAW